MSVGEVFTGMGYLAGALVFWLAAKGKGLATQGIGRLAIIGAFAGVLGAKVTQMIVSGWPVRVPPQAILNPANGGRALLGGLAIGWIAVEIAKRRMGIRRSTGDLFALALPAGEALGRIGCFLNGCCYGSPTNVQWAVYQHDAYRHPAQLYSAAAALVLFLALLGMRSKVTVEGQLFRLYLLGFGASRSVIEFFREQEKLIAGLSAMQWLCLELVVYAIVWLVLSSRRAASMVGAK